MKRSTIVLAALCAFAMSFAMATMAQNATNVAGTWELSMQMGERAFTRTLTLQQDGNKITGTAKSQRGGDAKVEGTLDGNNIKLTITSQGRNGNTRTQEYTGTVDGDNMKGTTTMNFGGQSNTANWTAKRGAAAAGGSQQ